MMRLANLNPNKFRSFLFSTWNLRNINKIGQDHTCSSHITHYECIINTINYANLKDRLDLPCNSKKACKNRAKGNKVPFHPKPDKCFNYFYQISSGENCAGPGCNTNLLKTLTNNVWVSAVDLNFCSEACAAIVLNLPRAADYHYHRNLIMFKAFCVRFSVKLKFEVILTDE